MVLIENALKAYDKISEILDKYQAIIIYHHIRPDGDCIGSQFGLAGIIRNNYPGKTVYIASGEYGSGPVTYLPVVEFNDYSHVDKSNALAIVVDTSVKSRIDGGEELDEYAEVLVIDHHPNECDVDNNTTHIRLTNRPACTQIIAEYAMHNNYALDAAYADVIYNGLVTDTGRFQYKGVDSKTFAVAMWLDGMGINKDYIYENLYKRTMKDIEFQKEIFNKIEFTEDKKVAFVKITKADQDKLELTPDECARVNMIGGIEGVESWNFFIQYPDFVRVEFRSSVRVEVNQVAFKWAGGGHKQAAGCRLDSMDDVIKVVKDINDCVNGKLTK